MDHLLVISRLYSLRKPCFPLGETEKMFVSFAQIRLWFLSPTQSAPNAEERKAKIEQYLRQVLEIPAIRGLFSSICQNLSRNSLPLLPSRWIRFAHLFKFTRWLCNLQYMDLVCHMCYCGAATLALVRRPGYNEYPIGNFT